MTTKERDRCWQRRLVDITVAGASLIVLSPLLILVAVAVKLDSRGPVLFRQQRVGKDGALFEILKFRSMIPGADQLGPKISGTRDPRVTRLGNVLRTTKLDELPQLWNVIRGDMTLVGPRAEVPEMVPHYTADERWLLSFTPGLTGPGQIYFTADQAEALNDVEAVEAHYIEHQLHAKLAKDLEYLRTREWMNDARIILRTVRLLLLPRRCSRK